MYREMMFEKQMCREMGCDVCDVVGVIVGSIEDQIVSGKLIKSGLVGRTIA
jgi:hypothetical protein